MNEQTKTTSVNSRRRSAFTLIELLFVIAIIAVLTSLAYGVMAEAQDDARVSATKSRIAQIESILQIVMEDFEVRRLPVRNVELLAFIDQNRIVTGSDQVPRGVQLKNLRRRIMLDLIKAEFPTAFLDVATEQLVVNPDLGNFPTQTPVLGSAPLDPSFDAPFLAWLDTNYDQPAFTGGPLLSAYLASRRTAEVLFWSDFAPTIPPITAIGDTFKDPGEYLYIQLSRVNIDGSTALELLGPNAVGDPDGDGFLDIVDAFDESLGLKILQAMPADETDITQDRWAFADTNWTQRSGPDALPTGYQIATSVVPSPISAVRIQVVSPTLELRGEQ